jgi:hypothetical protein
VASTPRPSSSATSPTQRRGDPEDKKELKDILGQKVNLVEFSVSHYLLARALESIKAQEKDLKVVNTSDADMAAAFKTPEVTAVVTWKPIVSTILESPDAHEVFDSSKIPGEIIDLMVANTEVVKDNPKFAKALAGIWYETLATMKSGNESKESMAKASGTDLKGFEVQLATTKLFSDPKDAVAFTNGGDLKTTTERVSKFLFEKSLLGKDAKTEGAVGVEFPDKTVFGDKGNVKFRYDATFMRGCDESSRASFGETAALERQAGGTACARSTASDRTWRSPSPFCRLAAADRPVIGSSIRLAENPTTLPPSADMGETIYGSAFEPDPRTAPTLVGYRGKPDGS